MKPHRLETADPTQQPIIVFPNNKVPILNKIPCIKIATNGVSVFVDGNDSFNKPAASEILMGFKVLSVSSVARFRQKT